MDFSWLDPSLHYLHDWSGSAGGTATVRQWFVERQDGLRWHCFHALSSALSPITAAALFTTQGIGTHSSKCRALTSSNEILSGNSNDSFLMDPRKTLPLNLLLLRIPDQKRHSHMIQWSYMDGSKKACIIASAMVGMIFLVVFGDKRHYLKKCNASKAAKDKERSVNRHEDLGTQMRYRSDWYH
ncbi:uncharacterized protein EAF01_012078 [Botrytis porri]|uniref:uncharacterized protein n=1 Tax=Botrytis porri TaxID=87229 RepID=UPI0019029427|nr:uncharacterized protein EAF01_012078 [Botrytis porri]KAF7880183.1 hypothetical protein EAF01_012078 [Botrytis porri]